MFGCVCIACCRAVLLQGRQLRVCSTGMQASAVSGWRALFPPTHLFKVLSLKQRLWCVGKVLFKREQFPHCSCITLASLQLSHVLFPA